MNNFKKHRQDLLEKIPKKSLVVLYSNSLHKRSEDSTYDFYVNRNFYYLTNISQENTLLILYKNENVKEYLFIDKYDEKKEKWFGKKLSTEEAKNLSQINNILFTENIDKEFIKFLDSGIENIYFDLQVEEELINSLKNKVSRININDIYPIIRELRMIKDYQEIENIKEAIKITNIGIKNICKNLSKTNKEIEIYNSFNCDILNCGTHEIAFPSIIGSGIHTCCLHYPNPLDVIPKNSLILCDVGSAYNHYASDITRTLPTSGKFTEFQKVVYEIVLNCNKKVIKFIKPGKTIKQVQEYAKTLLASKCLEIGLIKKMDEIDKYFFHGVSHHLGLDVHDVSDRNIPLIKGMILTVEPGLYIKEKKIGIRIEDDVLVTENGSECLSKDIVKEIKDIEQLFIYKED